MFRRNQEPVYDDNRYSWQSRMTRSAAIFCFGMLIGWQPGLVAGAYDLVRGGQDFADGEADVTGAVGRFAEDVATGIADGQP